MNKKLFYFFALLLVISTCSVRAQEQPLEQDQIGQTISASGNSVALSADGTVMAVNDNHSVKVYKNMAGTWTQIGATISGISAGDTTGTSISLSSDGTALAV